MPCAFLSWPANLLTAPNSLQVKDFFGTGALGRRPRWPHRESKLEGISDRQELARVVVVATLAHQLGLVVV